MFRHDHHSAWFDNCIGIANTKALLHYAVVCAVISLMVLAVDFTAFYIWT